MTKAKITVETTINAPLKKVWEFWTKPEHVMQWNHASDDWHCPYAENDLAENGKFKYTMASRDGKMSFDFEGIFTRIKEHEAINYLLGDGRTVEILFAGTDGQVNVVETFEAEQINSVELQQAGWQSILNNFKKHVEK
jgi:uncharacterized protein YndB with AHSA1/START domain